MTLAVDIRHRLGEFRLDARFATGGGLVALFGKSGSGKSSVINVIAGLIRPEEGRVSVDGEELLDTARGLFVPTHRRRLGYVFQEGRLFPHLTVRQNLLYGRWFGPPAARRDGLDRVVDLLGLEATLERRPARLSGGEKQRVAIGRALLADPRLLLMDEPLASLDEQRKLEILPYIERLRDEAQVPIVYVSHSVAEVARLASTVVLLSQGTVVAVGPTREIMQRVDLFPLTGRAEAGVVIEATVEGHDERFGLTTLRSRAGTWRLPRVRCSARRAAAPARAGARCDAGQERAFRRQRAQCHHGRGRGHVGWRGPRRGDTPRLQRRGAYRPAHALLGRAPGIGAGRAGACPRQERGRRPARPWRSGLRRRRRHRRCVMPSCLAPAPPWPQATARTTLAMMSRIWPMSPSVAISGGATTRVSPATRT